jgi:predicted ATP-binding protein involved in virulence
VTDKPFEEIGYVQMYILEFASLLPGIKGQPHDIDFFGVSQSDSGFQLAVYFKNGDFSRLQDLPAGYRRLYSIVLDMAYRSYILNETTEPEGVVVMDEIDLHLHPELEKEVVNALHKTFPRVQFIMSTHSPAVLTNLHTEYGESQILRMEEGYTQPKVIKDVYGLDYNTRLEDVMGVEARAVELYNLLDSLAYYENMGLSKQANNVRMLLLGKLNGNENRLDEMLSKRRKEMGDEIHQ